MLERFEKVRRAGRDLSGDAELHYRAALPGLFDDDPQMIRALDEFEKLGIDCPEEHRIIRPTFRMQPCLSPVWDTAQAMFALGEAGSEERSAHGEGRRLDSGKEVRQRATGRKR